MNYGGFMNKEELLHQYNNRVSLNEEDCLSLKQNMVSKFFEVDSDLIPMKDFLSLDKSFSKKLCKLNFSIVANIKRL